MYHSLTTTLRRFGAPFAVSALLGIAPAAHAQSGIISVAATSVLEGAGRTGAAALASDGSGTAAPTISLAAGTNRILTFSTITGSITYNGGVSVKNSAR